jgi:hypothetical protein
MKRRVKIIIGLIVTTIFHPWWWYLWKHKDSQVHEGSSGLVTHHDHSHTPEPEQPKVTIPPSNNAANTKFGLDDEYHLLSAKQNIPWNRGPGYCEDEILPFPPPCLDDEAPWVPMKQRITWNPVVFNDEGIQGVIFPLQSEKTSL